MTLLRNRNLRTLLVGATLSQLGDICFMVALPWLVLQMTGSGLALGSVLLALAVPRAALMLVGGAVSDRFSARRVLIAANLALMLCVASVTTLEATRTLAPWMLYVVAIVFGTADAFALPAIRVLVPAIVPTEQIAGANALLQSCTQLCMLVGAALAGILIARFGIVWAFGIDAFSFAFLIAALAAISISEDPRVHTTSLVSSIGSGIAHVWRDPLLRALLLTIAAVNFCLTGATQVGIATLVHARFASAADFGALVTASAVGSLLGIALAGIWTRRSAVIPTLLGASALLGLCIASIALPLSIAELFGVLVSCGAIAGYVNVYVISSLQSNVGAEVRGRVMSLVTLASIGVAPLSLAVSGAIATVSIPLLMVGAGCTLVGVAVAGAALGRVGASRQLSTNAR